MVTDGWGNKDKTENRTSVFLSHIVKVLPPAQVTWGKVCVCVLCVGMTGLEQLNS